jgi:hypothetical protein
MALNYADMDRYSSDGGNAFQGMLNSGSSMGSFLEKINAFREGTKGMDPDTQKLAMFAMPGLFGAEPIPYLGPEGMKQRNIDTKNLLKEMALEKAEMNEKANDRALFNTMISKFGDNIARALGGPSWDTIERNRATGLTAINNINPSTLQPLTTAQFQSRNYYS